MVAQDSAYVRRHSSPPKKKFDWSKVFVGGNVGMQFGTSTFVAVSPLVGYRINSRFSAGIGATYQYYHYQDKLYNITSNIYGGRVFGRYFITQNLFAHAEYEVLNLTAYDSYPPRRVDVGSLLAGGGYIQRFGRNSGVTAMILYNFTESVYTPYQNPIIRVGMVFGL
jgi:long-subunit fatty acid transport protein